MGFCEWIWGSRFGEKCVPKNTVISTKWAISKFTAWQRSKNQAFRDEPDKQVPSNLLKLNHCKVLSKWLSLLIAETRKQDGSNYPPKSLYLLLMGILRHMRSKNPDQKLSWRLSTAACEKQGGSYQRCAWSSKLLPCACSWSVHEERSPKKPSCMIISISSQLERSAMLKSHGLLHPCG